MNIQKILKLPQLSANLTGAQITEVLNSLLYSALQPIFLSTNLCVICLSEVLTKAYADKRRKMSFLPHQEFLDLLYTVLTNKPKVAWEYFKSLKLERSITFKIITLFLELTKDYEKAELEYCKLNKSLELYERLLDCDYSKIGCIIKTAKFYLDLYLKFKGMIMQKYYRLAYKEACRRERLSATFIDKEDLWKTLVIAISSAIDKYSEEKGALASHITQQFKSAIVNPEEGYEYGQAYDIPYYYKLKVANVKSDGLRQVSFANPLTDNMEDTIAIDSDIDSCGIYNNPDSDRLIRIINNTPGTEIASLVLGLCCK